MRRFATRSFSKVAQSLRYAKRRRFVHHGREADGISVWPAGSRETALIACPLAHMPLQSGNTPTRRSDET